MQSCHSLRPWLTVHFHDVNIGNYLISSFFGVIVCHSLRFFLSIEGDACKSFMWHVFGTNMKLACSNIQVMATQMRVSCIVERKITIHADLLVNR